MNPQKRFALVIGNSNYRDENVVSGTEEAKAIQVCLKSRNFKVFSYVDADFDTTHDAMSEFAAEIGDAEVALIFYAGHGAQIDNKNYLIPTDGSIGSGRVILLDDLVQNLGYAPDSAVKLAFLNACRENLILPEAFPKGFTDPPPLPLGTLLAFATSPGQLAESGLPGEISDFAKALVKFIPEPGLELVRLLAKVNEYVDEHSSGQQTFVAGTIPQKFFFRDPVFIQAVTPGWPNEQLIVLLNDEIVLSTKEAVTTSLQLNAGTNQLALFVAHGRSFDNDSNWNLPQGWRYHLDLILPGGATITFDDREDRPFKSGPHHGGVFLVARAVLHVASQGDEVVTVTEIQADLWKRECPFWARDQDLLFEQSISDLASSSEDIFRDADLGPLSPVLRPLAKQLLTTGHLLGVKLLDPSRIFATVYGNKALGSVVDSCMTTGREDRIRDLRVALAATFHGVRRPFDLFDEGLNACLRANGGSLGIPEEDIRIWTAFDDRSHVSPENEALPVETEVAPHGIATWVVVDEEAGAEITEELKGLAQDAILHPRSGEALIVRSTVQRTVQGISISAEVYVFLSLQPIEDRIRVQLRLVADLTDLQNKIGALVDSIPLPKDNCSHFGIDNVVARIWGKKISVNDDIATLKLNGDVDIWTCVKNPIPCTRVEWEERFGIRIPKLVYYDCNPPIKNRNISQPFEAMLPFTLELVDARTVAVRLGTPSVDLGGTLGGVTEGILRIAGVDLNAQVKQVLDAAIGSDLLAQALPEFLARFDPSIKRAEFLNNSGSLALAIELEASLDLLALGTLIEWLVNQIRDGFVGQ